MNMQVVGGWACRFLIGGGFLLLIVFGFALLWRWLHPRPVKEIVLHEDGHCWARDYHDEEG